MIDAWSIGTTVACGPLLVAVPLAIVAGLVSFLSPCCLPLVPGHLAYLTGAAGADADNLSIPTRRSATVFGTALFVLGFALVFTSYGAAFGASGGNLMRHQDVTTRVPGLLTIVLGQIFCRGARRRPWGIADRAARLPTQCRVGGRVPGVMFGIGRTRGSADSS